MLLSELLREAQERLERAGVESARLEAQLLVAHGLEKDRAWVLAHPEAKVNEAKLESLLTRREKREPLAYILGYREFYGRRFEVSPDVLIPRQETETLVEAALSAMPQVSGLAVLDLGTGSGCVGISIALERPDSEVWLSDVSVTAIEVAKANAANLGAEIDWAESNLFGFLSAPYFDLVVSNPPYVRADAILAPEVGEWEPGVALYAGADGMDFYRRLAAEGRRALREGGVLLVEVGDEMNDAVAAVFDANGWDLVTSRRDLVGHERVLTFAAKRD